MPDGFASAQPAPEVTIDEDGGVTIAAPAVHTREPETPESFGQNLALEMDDGHLSDLAHEILEGVDADIASRKSWLDNYANGMDLLGLQIEKEGSDTRVAKIGHPMLLEAVVKGQSAAASELMPSTGPCKVEERDGDSQDSDAMARALASDMNWYLTRGAREYYPDFDRGLFGLMYSGNLFKKIYEHPLRRRPVGETINVDDMIVSEDATDLDTAIRVTHRSEPSPAFVKRMQWRGVWRDVMLAQPSPSLDAAQRKRDDITGVMPISLRPSDMSRTIYQTTTDLCLADYGLTERHAPGDLPISYAVTVDKDSRQVLDVRREWKRDDQEFSRRQRYVHYGMIPAFGFLCLGHVHLLGNQTKALRAIWRILVTAGMYANAPGGMKAKGVRTSTTEVRPAPGEWVDIDLGPFDDIGKALMAMPYKDPSAVFIQLADLISKESGQLASAASIPTGEGRADIPVGTILAMIEQSTQIASATHKRFYRTQARELELFKECFAENPEALTKLNPDPAYRWREAAEFADQNLLPASDPNVPSQMHRIMLSTAMIMLAGQNPDIYDKVQVHTRAWQNMGVRDVGSFLHEPTPQPGAPGPDPSLGQARLLEAQGKIAKVQQDGVADQRKAATEAIEAQHQTAQLATETQTKQQQLDMQERIESERLAVERERLAVEEVRAQREHGLALAGLQQADQHHGADLVVKKAATRKAAAKAPKGKRQ